MMISSGSPGTIPPTYRKTRGARGCGSAVRMAGKSGGSRGTSSEASAAPRGPSQRARYRTTRSALSMTWIARLRACGASAPTGRRGQPDRRRSASYSITRARTGDRGLMSPPLPLRRSLTPSTAGRVNGGGGYTCSPSSTLTSATPTSERWKRAYLTGNGGSTIRATGKATSCTGTIRGAPSPMSRSISLRSWPRVARASLVRSAMKPGGNG